MSRPIVAFRRAALEDARRMNAESDILRLVPAPLSGDPPAVYLGLLREVEHFRPGPHGIHACRDPLGFSVHIPDEYLRSADPNLQFRVLQVHSPIVHPNVRGRLCCMGPRFQPGTRLRALIEQAYWILSSRVFATDHPFDLEARAFYLHHVDSVRGLRASPLWRQPVAGRVRVTAAAQGAGPATEEQP